MYKRRKKEEKQTTDSDQICHVVKKVRQLLPRTGTRKLLDIMRYALKEREIRIGRDRLFSLLRSNQLLVARRKRHFFTTDSKHRFYKYGNKVQDLKVDRAEQLWVSDITYIKSREGNMYLSLITDAYSRKIVGYHLADHLKASGPIEALRMALKGRRYKSRRLMHHSDKGIQYCCDEYVGILESHGIEISMTTKYDPYENAIAERVNGTIKVEFELDGVFPDKSYARREIAKTIQVYNTIRPHASCGMLPPEVVHNNGKPESKRREMQRQWARLFFNNFKQN